MGRSDLWQDDAVQVELCKRFCFHPILRYQAYMIVVRYGFKDRDREVELVFLLLHKHLPMCTYLDLHILRGPACEVVLHVNSMLSRAGITRLERTRASSFLVQFTSA